MAKDFAAVNRMELEAGLATVGNGKDELVSKFVKAWENQTARRALKGGTGISMALTLAACGGGSDDTSAAPVTNLPTAEILGADAFVAAALAGTLPEAYSLEIADATVGPLTVAEFVIADEAVQNAQNADEFDAAQVDGTITITVTVEDTAANIIASAANFEGADNVTVSVLDTAANVVAAAADLVDAEGTPIVAIAVSDEAPVVSAADLAALQSLAATFAATPAVEDTLAGADGVAIDGAEGVTLSVGSVTPGADAIDATIIAAGTGTITFDFADADDTVTLSADSSITGFTTLSVVAGSVDVTAANIGAEVTVVEVSSGITMTAAQFLTLDAVTAGSDASDITIVVANNTEAQAVIAQAGKVMLTEGATFEFVNAEGGTFNDAQKAAADADFQQAYDTATTTSALPQAISNLLAAETAQADFVAPTVATLKANGLDVDGEGNAVVTAKSTFAEVAGFIEGSVDALEGAVDAFAAGPDTIYGEGAFINGDAALKADIIAAVETALAKAATDATTAASEARTAINDAGLANQTKAVFDLAVASFDANAAYNDARDAAIGSYEEIAPEVFRIVDQTGTLQEPITKLMVADDAVDTASFYVASSNGALGVEINFTDAVDGFYTTFATVNITKTGYNLDGTKVEETADGYVLTVFVNEARDTAEITVPKADFDALMTASFEVQGLRTDRDAADEAFAEGVADLSAANPDANYEFGVEGLVVAGGDPDAVVDYMNALFAEKGAVEAQAQFEGNIADWTVLTGLNDDAAALVKGFDAAVAAIENNDTDTPAGLSVDVVGLGAEPALDNADPAQPLTDQLYIFDADAPMMVGDFGVVGVDYIYFGTEYNYVSVDASALPGGIGQALEGSLGSASTLDVIAITDEIGTVVFVEDIATAGNGTTDVDMTMIVAQEGLDAAEHLAFNSDTGILSAEGAGPIV